MIKKVLRVWMYFYAGLFHSFGLVMADTFDILGDSLRPKPKPRGPRKPAWYKEAIFVREKHED